MGAGRSRPGCPGAVPRSLVPGMTIMTFRETLDKHLRAIRERDLPSLVETLPDETLTLIMSDGRLVGTVREFVDLHRDWFEQTTWTLETKVVASEEAAQ